MKKFRIHHLFNRGGAARTKLAASVGKFETAMAAHDLMFFLGGNRPVALAAADEAGERKFMGLGTRIAVSPEQHLHPVIFRLRNHPLMLSLI